MRHFITAFLLCFFTALSAQDTKFSDNPGDFVNQLDGFMNASKRPDMAESYSVFKKAYKSGVFQENELKQIIAVSNRMKELKLSAFPYFKNYVNAITAAKSNPDSTVFQRWHLVTFQTLNAAVQGKVKPVSQFLDFSADFMGQNALKAGEGGSVSWKLKGGTWDFQFIDSSKQAILVVENTHLFGLRKKDSIGIYNTSGIYYPAQERWVGRQGKVTWENVGLDSSVYALLTGYTIDANKPLFKSDTATLFYPLYFPQGPIQGSLQHYVEVSSRDSLGQYPKFESFAKTLSLNKIGDGIEYKGGFKLWGSSVYGYGNPVEPARLKVFNAKRQPIFDGTSDLFVIKRESSVVAENVDAKMKMDDGTEITHPGSLMRLDIKRQNIVLERGQKGSQRNPFYSTFYNMNLDAERIAYHFNADSLEIGAQIPGRKGVPQTVAFESNNLYEPGVMLRLQNIAERNPISTLYLLAMRIGESDNNIYVVPDDSLAVALNPKWNNANIQTLLAQMVAEGFINYYFERHQIVLRDKLIHYALASAGKRDFDAIKIESTTAQSNARLDLKSKQTTINEVKRLELSNRQHVAVIPQSNKLVLLKNRDMRLSGRLFAGYALFEGRDMAFNYDKFEIQFDSVKNLDFYLPYGEKGSTDNELRKANAMNSTIEYISGVLLVDAPNNKSGKENLNMFPSMQSKKHSYVYYQRPEAQQNAYQRDSFFFRLDPFSFDALDNYEPEDLKFKGEMHAASIFPPFRETIVVRTEDKSFGFIHRTPQAGYPTYSRKGNFIGTVDLSNKGFLGKGTVTYLTADIESEDLIFKPKQMTGTAKKFFMKEDRTGAVKTPQAQGQDVKVNWLPYRDSMYVESRAKDFTLFKAEGFTHKGVLVLTPSGLKGRGIFEWDGGKLTSKLIAYGPFQAGADTADLQIKALDGQGIAFDSKNIDGELDFDKQYGKFKANTADANTNLPRDKYQTSMNEFDWDMKQQTIKFKADPNKPAVFISTDENRDALKFNGKTAIYDLKTNLLKIGGVEVIPSADAYIYTENGEVEIQPGGGMKELNNCRIVADTVNKYHTINRATVNISGKKDYKAKGYYQYDIPGYQQEVFFDNIIGERVGGGTRSTKNVLTSASGPLKEESKFRMDVKTFFKGDIQLEANKPNLRFEGFAKLDADQLPGSKWFMVNTTIDKNAPLIRIKNSKNEQDDPLITGIYLARDTTLCYPRVLLPAYARIDRPLINVQDYFKYDPTNDRFIFGDSARVAGVTTRGSQMIFDNRVGSVVADGPIALGSGLEYMKVKAAGKLRTSYQTVDSTGYKINGEVMSGADFFLPAKLMDALVNGLRAGAYDAPNAIYTAQNAFYQQALPEFVPPGTEGKIVEDLKSNLILLPKTDNKFALLFGRHNIVWNPEYQSFLSTDDKMPLITANGEQINKVMTTYVEYKMPSNEDDRFYAYIAPTPDLWYFFGYQAGVLNVASSDPKFNEILLAMKPKDLQVKMPDGELYEVIAANPALAQAFVSRVKEGRKL